MLQSACRHVRFSALYSWGYSQQADLNNKTLNKTSRLSLIEFPLSVENGLLKNPFCKAKIPGLCEWQWNPSVAFLLLCHNVPITPIRRKRQSRKFLWRLFQPVIYQLVAKLKQVALKPITRTPRRLMLVWQFHSRQTCWRLPLTGKAETLPAMAFFCKICQHTGVCVVLVHRMCTWKWNRLPRNKV